MKFDYTHTDGTSYENYRQYVWSGLFGFCVCSGESEEFFFKVLKEIWDEHNKTGGPYSSRYEGISEVEMAFQELCLMLFDKYKLTEHGVSVRGSWLTDEGARVCQKLFRDKS